MLGHTYLHLKITLTPTIQNNSSQLTAVKRMSIALGLFLNFSEVSLEKLYYDLLLM